MSLEKEDMRGIEAIACGRFSSTWGHRTLERARIHVKQVSGMEPFDTKARQGQSMRSTGPA